jgi:hypothetical protein
MNGAQLFTVIAILMTGVPAAEILSLDIEYSIRLATAEQHPSGVKARRLFSSICGSHG